jgi:hypothetical protein
MKEASMKSPMLFGALALALFALMPASALATDANGNHNSYFWVVGADEPFTETAMAPNGNTITMSGSGTLTAGPGNTASGGGTYSFSSGGSGTWTVTGVQGFVNYGEGIPQGLPGTFGGQTKLDITLDNGDSGVLTIVCLLGSPPAGKMESISVILGRGGQYTKPVSGDNIFLPL